MADSSTRPFDFDYWSALAARDPDHFERSRREYLEQTIASASPRSRERLRCLQWKLDRIRQTAGSPLAAAIRMNEMMWERVVGPGGLLEVLLEAHAPRAERAVTRNADVLPFRAPNA